ncbi:MAG: O-antigen ligase family protein [Eubacteriales bacterium]|nr:O-antigen ligase family protein [Eubacteriales bacterium]
MNQNVTLWHRLAQPRWLKYAAVAVGMFAATPYGTALTEVTNKVFLLWGALLILRDTLGDRVWTRATASLVWLAALIFGALTVALHANVTANTASWACNAVLFAVFFTVDSRRDEADVRREIRTFSHVALAVGLWVVIVSLGKGLFGINQPVLGAYQGMVSHENRLWGWCSNANGLGQVSWLTIMAAAVAAALCEKRRMRLWYIVPMALGFVAMALSDSRSCLLALMAFGGGATFFLAADAPNKGGKRRGLRILAAAMATVVAAGALYGAGMAVQAGYPAVSRWASASSVDEWLRSLSGQGNGQGDGQVDPAQPNVIGRENEWQMNGDVLSRLELSSGRFYLWGIGVEILKDNPLLGVGQANVYDASVSQRSTDPRAHLHNGYLQTAVADGLVGFGLLLVLGACVAAVWGAALKRRLGRGGPGNAVFYLLMAAGVSVAVNNLFESSFYHSLGMVTTVFWVYLGYSVYYAGIGGHRRPLSVHAAAGAVRRRAARILG